MAETNGLDHFIKQAKANQGCVLTADQVQFLAAIMENMLREIADLSLALDTQDDLLDTFQKALDAAGIESPFDEVQGEVLPFGDQEALKDAVSD